MISEYEKDMKEIWKEYEGNMKRIRSEYVEDVKEIWREYEENMKRIRSEYEEDMKEIWKEYEENMKRIGSEYEEVMIRELKLTLEFMKTKYIWEKVKITCSTGFIPRTAYTQI